MLQRFSAHTRRVLASLLLAALPQTACGYMHDLASIHRHRQALEAFESGRPDEIDKTSGPLQAARDRLREARARAWAHVAAGQDPDGYDMDDARALSAATRTVDVAAGWDHTPATGHATLADLPRSEWWYLFTPPSAWRHGPLAIDRDRLPGYYAAMMDAFDHIAVTAKPGAPAFGLTSYADLHRLATTGVFDGDRKRAVAPGFAHSPTQHRVATLHDLGALHVDHMAQALAELKAEGIAGWNAQIQRDTNTDALPAWLVGVIGPIEDINPNNKPVKLLFQRGQREHAEESLVAHSAYEPHEAERWVSQWLADFAAESQQASRIAPAVYLDVLAVRPVQDDFLMELLPNARATDELSAMVRPVAKLLRRMHVSHVSGDGVDAVDTSVVLNYLLVSNGLPPAVIDDPSIFCGREPLDVLAAEIVKGQQRFQVLVRQLVARAPAGRDAAPTPGRDAAPLLGRDAVPPASRDAALSAAAMSR